ncbi:MAG TPA: MBL fold metallo-hydrolase, partial [Vicinamibacterales bacterium]
MNPCVFVVLACLAVLGGCRAPSAPESTEPSFTLKQVAPGVWAAISNAKSSAPAPANTGFVIGDDGVAVIDASMSVDAEGNLGIDTARQTLAALRTLTKLPIRFVINTHYHMDHVGGNPVFVEAGAVVLAHPNVRGWIHDEHLRLLTKDSKPEHKAFMEALLPPTVTYDESVDLHLGTRTIRVRSLPGHTGGDSVVLVPDAKVVFAGDLLWRDMVPTLVDASTQPWIDTLDWLATNEPGATFVPGHGEVGTAQDVVALREYLVTLRRLVSDAQAAGTSGEALADAVMPGLSDRYSRWDGFEYASRPNILETDAELRGKKRIPQAPPRSSAWDFG